jgi:NAD(P)-dependent dehydrogenase (short-subunit alcohol dehydrogenase family)
MIVTAQLDVANLAAIEPVVATLAERLGRLDVVFANAGVAVDGDAVPTSRRGPRN